MSEYLPCSPADKPAISAGYAGLFWPQSWNHAPDLLGFGDCFGCNWEGWIVGMFDWLQCDREGFDGSEMFQTKDTPRQMLDLYQIRADGTLWHQDYDIEDRSDPSAEGLSRLAGIMTRINERWEQDLMFTGEIYFYGDSGEFSAYFIKGALQSITDLAEVADGTSEAGQ